MTPPTPAASAPADPATAKLFRTWQIRTLIGTMFGYAAFYFVRKNLSFAMPEMQSDLGISKTDLGIFLTLHGLLYGVSRFVNGMWADRANARYFMVAGLLLSVGANVFFGFSSTVLWLGVAWMINGWVQGMGFPPCCRLMTHWFRPERLASTMSIWNTSHSIGAALAGVACGYFVLLGWRWCFFAPAILCTVAGGILFLVLRDTPRSVGLPEIAIAGVKAEEQEDRTSAGYKAFVKKQVFLNPFIWYICLANFFVYILRFAVLDWGPTLLKEMKHFPLQKTGWMVGAFEVSGIVGMLIAGWVTDRVFQGRGARTCVFLHDRGLRLAAGLLATRLHPGPRHRLPRRRRLLHLRPAGADRHHRRQPRHAARVRHRRRLHRPLQLRQHARDRLGPRLACPERRLAHRLRGPAPLRRRRYRHVRPRLARPRPRLPDRVDLITETPDGDHHEIHTQQHAVSDPSLSSAESAARRSRLPAPSPLRPGLSCVSCVSW
jgi:sugar phosphate permease